MKNILCFGDSNTYGFNPKNGTRYDANTRWTGIIKKELDANIIEAGCNNRTAFSNNPLGDEFTGFKAIAKYIKKELDIVILSIGINDLQTIYNTNINDYEQGLENLIDIIKKYNNKTKIILCSPSIINENIFNNHFSNFITKT